MSNVEGYLTKAHESLRGAESEHIAERPNNAVNRAYYAAFQAAVAALLDAGIPVQRGQGGLVSHQAVHSQFAGILVSRRKLYPANLRSVLQDLLRERIIADYRPVNVSHARATRALRRAQGFLAAVTARLQSKESTS